MRLYSNPPPGPDEFDIEIVDEANYDTVPATVPKVPWRGYRIGRYFVARESTFERGAADWAVYKPHWRWWSYYNEDGVQMTIYGYDSMHYTVERLIKETK